MQETSKLLRTNWAALWRTAEIGHAPGLNLRPQLERYLENKVQLNPP